MFARTTISQVSASNFLASTCLTFQSGLCGKFKSLSNPIIQLAAWSVRVTDIGQKLILL